VLYVIVKGWQVRRAEPATVEQHEILLEK